jgi:hypothetical protein
VGGHDRARARVINKDEARAASANPTIDRLHQLTTRSQDRSRQMTSLEFFGCAHIEHVGCSLVRFAEPWLEGAAVDAADAEVSCDDLGAPLRNSVGLGADRVRFGARSALEVQTGKALTLRSAGEGEHPVGDTGIDQ